MIPVSFPALSRPSAPPHDLQRRHNATPCCLPEDLANPDTNVYHTIKELKNGAGAPPIKTSKGWLHVAHAVRNNAAGMRYVLYAFLCDLNEPWKVIARPGGYFLAPEGEERVGDVSDVVFMNGMVARKNGELLIYYASSDTRTHVARTTVGLMLDYVCNTPQDAMRSPLCVDQRCELIQSNHRYLKSARNPLLGKLSNLLTGTHVVHQPA